MPDTPTPKPECPKSMDGRHDWIDTTTLGDLPIHTEMCRFCCAKQEYDPYDR